MGETRRIKHVEPVSPTMMPLRCSSAEQAQSNVNLHNAFCHNSHLYHSTINKGNISIHAECINSSPNRVTFITQDALP